MLEPKSVVTALFTAACLLSCPGCSLIGLGIGAIVDAKTPDAYVLNTSGLDSIKQGSFVQVLKVDGDTVVGKFEYLEPSYDAEYAKRYSQFIKSVPEANLYPALGDSVSIVKNGLSGRDVLTGKLLGFDRDVIHIHLSESEETARVLVEAVDTIRNERAAVLDGNLLRQQIIEGDLPLASAIAVETGAGKHEIFLDDIARVRYFLSKNAKWVGLGVGFLVDAAAFAVFAATFRIDLGTK